MKNKGIRKKLINNCGKYSVDIEVSVAEWKSMLANEDVFFESAK